MSNFGDGVTVLIGAGAEVNAWQPIVRALNRFGGFDIESSCEANDILTQVVHNRRYFALANEYARRRNFSADAPSAKGLSECEASYAKICDAIRNELQAEPSREAAIQLRPEFSAVWNRVVKGASVCVMTTNWDLSISTELQRQWPDIGHDAVMHLHGDQRSAMGFVLPNEVTFEPYRNDEEIQYLNKRRRAIISTLEQAKRLVIYGLSLSPLDAELAHVLTSGIELGAVDEIDIVDPQHRRVARRLIAMIPSRRPVVVGRSPRELESTVRYEWSK
jgi:hypothetical protein